MHKKIHGDAKLKTLPAERQASIYARLCAGTIAKVQAELAGEGLRVGHTALSEFLSWYALRASFAECEANSATFMELVQKELPTLDQKKVAEFGEAFFNLQAVKLQDPKLFLAMQTAKHNARMDQARLEQKDREIELAERRIKLLEQKAEQADKARAVTESALTPEEKQMQMRAIFGMQ